MKKMRFAWLPESPNRPGVYGVVQSLGVPYTYDANAALQFSTREECQAWCDENPLPMYVPKEHGFC